ncbi:hypothetical protein LPJ72_002427 [Coemansia sp. Benny D160-2]|nr:hypothetical protein LPJ72_002427 [Coemansia sp. Benny D160-2]
MSDTGRSDGHDDDEFGGFGVENYDDGEDFGDFGDFGEQTSLHAQASDPESHNVDGSLTSQHTTTTTTDISPSLSVIDSTLAQAAPLLDDVLSDHARGETLEECISNIFSNLPDCNESSKTDSEEPKLDELRLDNSNNNNDDDSSYIATTTTSTTNADETVAAVLRRNTSTHGEMEPRLLRNLLLVSVASESLDSRDIRYLLTPLSKIITDLEAHKKKKHSKKLPLLTMEEIQAIALSQEQQPSLSEDLVESNSQANGVDGDDDDNVLGALKHALVSIDALIVAKTQEIDKKRDDIVAYNQVIQKLIAQASKLH